MTRSLPSSGFFFYFLVLNTSSDRCKVFLNSEVKQEAIHENNLMDYNSESSVWQNLEIILMWRSFKIFICFLQERIFFIAQTKRELFWRSWNERLGSFTLLSLKFLAEIRRDISLTGQICNWCASQFWQDKLQIHEHTNDL